MTRDPEGIDAMTPPDDGPACVHCGWPRNIHDDEGSCRNSTMFEAPPPRVAIADMPGPLRAAGLGRGPWLDSPTIVPGLYRHTKSGGEYLVPGGSLFATGESQRVDVVYYSPEHGYQAHRTQSDFLDPCKFPDGRIANRFEIVNRMEPAAIADLLDRIVTGNLKRLSDGQA